MCRKRLRRRCTSGVAIVKLAGSAPRNKVVSVAALPISSGTSRLWLPASGSNGLRVKERPSRTGRNGSGTFFIAASNCATGSFCKAAPSARARPSVVASCAAWRAASSGPSRRRPPEMLCAIALWNSPLAAGIFSSVVTFEAPPDWPKIVTLLGSPPKACALSRTQRKAATRSSRPALPASAKRSSLPLQIQIAEHVQAVVDGHHHHVAMGGERAAVEARGCARAGGPAAAMQPHHDRAQLTGCQFRRINIEVQAVFAHGLQRHIPGVQRRLFLGVLRRGIAERIGVTDAGPGRHRCGRQKAVRAPGRGGVGNSLEADASTALHAAQLAAAGFHHGGGVQGARVANAKEAGAGQHRGTLQQAAAFRPRARCAGHVGDRVLSLRHDILHSNHKVVSAS